MQENSLCQAYSNVIRESCFKDILERLNILLYDDMSSLYIVKWEYKQILDEPREKVFGYDTPCLIVLKTYGKYKKSGRLKT